MLLTKAAQKIIDQAVESAPIARETGSKNKKDPQFGQLLRELIELIPIGDSLDNGDDRVQFEDDPFEPLRVAIERVKGREFNGRVKQLGKWTGYQPSKIWSFIAEDNWANPTEAEIRRLLSQFTANQPKIQILVNRFAKKDPYASANQMRTEESTRRRTLTKEQKRQALERMRQNPIRQSQGYPISAGSVAQRPTANDQTKQLEGKLFKASVYIGPPDDI